MNRALWTAGIRITRVPKVPLSFVSDYRSALRRLRRTSPPRFRSVVQSFTWEAGEHPVLWWDFECAFAAEHIARVSPTDILDIGSIRSFIAGLMAHYRVTTVDVREREALLENETVITTDAKRLDLPDNSFDVVVSLCALEHFGLGRYGVQRDGPRSPAWWSSDLHDDNQERRTGSRLQRAAHLQRRSHPLPGPPAHVRGRARL